MEKNNISSEKRIHQRFETDIQIMTVDETGLTFAFIRDLSHGGAYIETKTMVPVGKTMPITLTNGRQHTLIQAKVLRHVYCERNLRPIGMAVEFDLTDGKDRYIRDDLLLYAMTKKYLDVWDQPAAAGQNA
jgi:hypothetical protein